MDERYSSLTGITNLSFLIVIILSCKYLAEEEWIILFSLFLISCSNDFCFLLMSFNSTDASSEIYQQFQLYFY